MQSNNNNIIEFEVPEELKECGITRIAQVGPFVKTLYKGQSISANFDVAKLKKSTDELREEAGKIITSNGIDASDIIEKLVSHVMIEATNRYEKDLAEGNVPTNGNGKAQKQVAATQQQGDGATKEQVATMKYTSIVMKQQPDSSVLPIP